MVRFNNQHGEEQCNGQHFVLIIEPGGQGDRNCLSLMLCWGGGWTVQPHYLGAKHGVAPGVHK